MGDKAWEAVHDVDGSGVRPLAFLARLRRLGKETGASPVDSVWEVVGEEVVELLYEKREKAYEDKLKSPGREAVRSRCGRWRESTEGGTDLIFGEGKREKLEGGGGVGVGWVEKGRVTLDVVSNGER